MKPAMSLSAPSAQMCAWYQFAYRLAGRGLRGPRTERFRNTTQDVAGHR